MQLKACALFDAHKSCGAEANMALLLAAESSWEAANACLQFHGGYGFARDYDVATQIPRDPVVSGCADLD